MEPGNVRFDGGGDGFSGNELEQPSNALGVPPRHCRKLLGRKGCAEGTELGIKVGAVSVGYTGAENVGFEDGAGGFVGSGMEQPSGAPGAPPRHRRKPVWKVLSLIIEQDIDLLVCSA